MTDSTDAAHTEQTAHTEGRTSVDSNQGDKEREQNGPVHGGAQG